ncbi:Tyrosine-protein phosphatase yvh1 [Hypsizygus marmoreus]|uniref:protein-tyrosine-phosphatase n=1 Tax=Hypsizygus marmoreus TaxID=39966 RepID=A0A369JPX4_HYPMA|nr:Tyrosine-protein phosphatase yvh1 [Hypsizygus marmoreus]
MLSFPAPRWQISSRSNSVPRPRYDRTASLIAPRVYLSDLATACDSEELKRLGITHVISVLEYDITIPDHIPEECKLQIRIADKSDVDILTHLPGTTEFITSALAVNETNKVLVHCFQGISRSAAIVCAYLIATNGMLAHEAVAHTQSKRGIVCPNLSFRKQLEAYAEQFEGERAKERKNRLVKIREDLAERFSNITITTGISQLRALMPWAALSG